MNPLRALHYLRLSPFDVSSEQGRADERYRLALWSMLANLVSKAMAMAVVLFSVRQTVPYLGAERFGVWMTVLSFAGMLHFLDLGVGNALVNQVAHAASAQDRRVLQRAISGGLGFLLLLGLAMGGGLSWLASLMPWDRLIKVQDPRLHEETRLTCELFGALMGLNLFSTGVQKVFIGLQQSFAGHLVAALVSALALALLWWAAANQAGIPLLLSINMGSQLLAGLVLLGLLARRGQFALTNIGQAVGAEWRPLFKVSGMFLVLQIGTMASGGADSLIISNTLGAAQVAVFSVTQRLFMFVSQPPLIVNAPLWGAYADAEVRGEKAFIRKTLKSSMGLTVLLSLLLGGVVLFFYEPLVALWTKGAVQVTSALGTAFFCWVLLECAGNAFSMFLNGTRVIAPQVATVVLFALVAIPLKFYGVGEAGVTGLVLAGIVAYLLTVVLPYVTLFRPAIREKLGV